jgi:hypothetical protein
MMLQHAESQNELWDLEPMPRIRISVENGSLNGLGEAEGRRI